MTNPLLNESYVKLINRTRASKIDMDEIVDKFDKTGDRRIPLS